MKRIITKEKSITHEFNDDGVKRIIIVVSLFECPVCGCMMQALRLLDGD